MLFRHADGNVLASVLPVLDESQFARFFGPADGVMFLAPDHPSVNGGVLCRAERGDEPAQPAPGMLRLLPEQMRAVEAKRLRRLVPGAMAYLRRHGGHRVEGVDDRALRQKVETWLDKGHEHGVRTEAGLRKWCYLQLFTQGRLTDAPGLGALLRDRAAPGTPDDRLDAVMSATIAALGGRG